MEEKNELDHLNAKTARRAAMAEAEAKARMDDRKKEFTVSTFKVAFVCLGVCAVAYMMVNAGAINQEAAAAITNAVIGVTCLRMGAWWGWVVKK